MWLKLRISSFLSFNSLSKQLYFELIYHSCVTAHVSWFFIRAVETLQPPKGRKTMQKRPYSRYSGPELKYVPPEYGADTVLLVLEFLCESLVKL